MMKSLRYRSVKDIMVAVLMEVLADAYRVRDIKFWK